MNPAPLQPSDGAVLADIAERMFDPLHPMIPTPDARLEGAWELDGLFTAKNALFDTQRIGLGDRCYYGFLAHFIHAPDQYIAVIRGTEQPIEWIEDAEFLPVQHPLGGMVESGFWSVYRSMMYEPLDKTSRSTSTGLRGVWDQLRGKPGARVTIIGHSLGAALAAYLTIDVAHALNAFVEHDDGDGTINALMYASPKPGDGRFGHEFDESVGRANYQVFNYIRDVVPRLPIGLPFGLGYQALPNVTVLRPGMSRPFADNVTTNHAAMNYAALLGYKAATTKPSGVEV